MTKVIIDTNIFINAIFCGDVYCKQILEMNYNNELILVISHKTYTELIYTFIDYAIKSGETLETIKKPLIGLIHMIRKAEICNPTKQTKFASHEADEKFFECAVCSDADYIITQDSGFDTQNIAVKNKKSKKVKIVSAFQFIFNNKNGNI